MHEYNPAKLEKKWQKEWAQKKVYKAQDNSKKKKQYVLDMFPYPSGAGLHVGHPKGYIGSDVFARMKRMQGFNVLHPMGYDAFGLPAEQYAIQHKIHPRKAVMENIKTFEKQLSLIGLSFDWDRKVNTTDPEYYRWTQWIFLKLYESWYDKKVNRARPITELIKIFEKNGNKEIEAATNAVEVFTATEWKTKTDLEKQAVFMRYRLAYEGYSEVNWCADLGTVLANDEVVDGPNGTLVSERGGYPVEKRQMRQWFLRITAYADRLLSGLEDLNWSSHIKEIERNWIGRSVGAEIEFPIENSKENIKVFTTRPDTLFGVTYIVLAPDHPLVNQLQNRIDNYSEVEAYAAETLKKAEESKNKTGVELKGIRAKNPATGEFVPIWTADYVLSSYGTGAVMAVPAHDERDFEFAQKYDLPIKTVVIPRMIDQSNPHVPGKEVIYRDAVIVIVRDPKTNTYLTLKWKKHPWVTFVMGGIETGETPIEAAVREIREETGYKNVKFIKDLGDAQSEFYAAHKGVNRVAHTRNLLFELINHEKEDISAEESDTHEVGWRTDAEIRQTDMTHSEMPLILNGLDHDAHAYTGEGILVHSEVFDRMTTEDARIAITKAYGTRVVKYKMRDAVFARQRYWGEPIPLIHEKNGLIKPLSEKNLPLKLPDVKSYEPTGTGESPLASVPGWIKKGYETNTMPGWAGSSWYFLRYMDPHNKRAFADKKKIAYWKNVDMYVGGQEHATGHVLYARFWHKFLRDYGLVVTEEPFQTWKNQGMILGTDNRKMSKRWGNVINPDDVVSTYGADTLRIYEMFMGPFEASLPWSTENIIGSRRFIERVWRLAHKVVEVGAKKSDEVVQTVLHKTIQKVTDDIQNFAFNTAVSSMMILVNEMEKGAVSKKDFEMFLKILSPFAPHVCEEIWHNLGEKSLIVSESWPKADQSKMKESRVTIAIQINGKVRGELVTSSGNDERSVISEAKLLPEIIKWLHGKEIRKTIFVPDRLVNFVVA